MDEIWKGIFSKFVCYKFHATVMTRCRYDLYPACRNESCVIMFQTLVNKIRVAKYFVCT